MKYASVGADKYRANGGVTNRVTIVGERMGREGGYRHVGTTGVPSYIEIETETPTDNTPPHPTEVTP